MQRLLLQFVVPALSAEFMDRRMIPFVLPSILLIAEGLTADEYLQHIQPSLLPVFKMEEPMQVSGRVNCFSEREDGKGRKEKGRGGEVMS